MPKTVISAQEVTALVDRGEKTLEIPPGAVLTPLAADIVAANGIRLSEGRTPLEMPEIKAVGEPEKGKTSGAVVFGSDHGGFRMKEDLKQHAKSLGFSVMDVGSDSEDPCDYPDFAYAVAKTVADGQAWRGVMIDGAGIGSCIVANKVPGVRAACCHNEFVARNAREHNDTNVLTLGSRVTGIEVAKGILQIWLESWFAGGRHKQRVDKMNEVDRQFRK